MKRNQTIRFFSRAFLVPALFLFAVTAGLAQEPKDTAQKEQKWIRAQSDNGEFSVEVPDTYDYSYDREGFTVADNRATFVMSDMGVFNSYRDGALLSFESYAVNDPQKAFAEVILGVEKRLGKIEEIKRNGKTFRQMTVKNDKYYLVRQYFISKTRLYILTAGARKEGSAAIDRFLKSVALPGSGTGEEKIRAEVPVVSFAALKRTSTVLKTDGAEHGKNMTAPKNAETPGPGEPGVSKMLIIAKPASYYTDIARMNEEQGLVQFRITFTANGGISRIEVLKELKYGLLRQALISAMRIKCLPKEENGVPAPVTGKINYGFQIY